MKKRQKITLLKCFIICLFFPFFLIRRMHRAKKYCRMLHDLQYYDESRAVRQRIVRFIELELGTLSYWRVLINVEKVRKRLERLT